MPGIQTGIELNDQFSGVLNHIVGSVNLAVSAMYDMQESMNADIDTSSLEGARAEINQATMAVNELEQVLSGLYVPAVSAPQVDAGNPSIINVDVNPVVPDPLVENPEPIRPQIQPRAPDKPVEVPFEWKSYDGLDVYISTGAERFQQELSSLNELMNQVNATQYKITQAANEATVISPEASYDVQGLENRLYSLFGQIQKFQDTSLEVGTDEANNQLERLRSQMLHLQQLQSSLNQAMDAGSVEDINDAYLRLTQSISNAQRYVRDTTAAQEHLNDTIDEGKNGQEEFNQKIQEGTYQAGGLMKAIKGAVLAYVSIQSIGKALNISDELVQTQARLTLITGDLEKTAALQDQIMASANRSRAAYRATADAVAKMGIMAKDAFSNTDELVAFTELINKQFTIAGASAAGQEAAMLQLTQAMASGVLRGEELNSIFEQAPTIIQTVADYLGVPIGQIRAMASEGKITSDIVKNAMLSSADEINEKFESMPYTFAQVWTTIQNILLEAFGPLLQVIGSGAQWIYDNWVTIEPILVGLAVAVGILTGAWLIHTAATWLLVAANQALIVSMLSNPILWIALLIGVLVGMIYKWTQSVGGLRNAWEICKLALLVGWNAVRLGFFVGVYQVIDLVDKLKLCWQKAGVAIANFMGDMKVAVLTCLQNMINNAIDIINDFLGLLNKLPGVNLEAIEHVTFAVTAAAENEATKQARAADIAAYERELADAKASRDAHLDSLATELVDSIGALNAAVAQGKAEAAANDGAEHTPDFDGVLDTSGIDDNLSNIAGDTGAIKDSMDITEEDLKYLRDIAEQEAVNRYTVAEIHVDMSGMQNTVNSGDNIDGFITKLTDSVNEAVDIMAEGEHK